MMTLGLAWQQFCAQWRAGDVRVLLLALIVAVTAITGVTFFIDRIASHLNNEGGLVLGGDMVMIADHPISAEAINRAASHQLQYTTTVEFPSMVIVGDKNQLAEVKALNRGFPLRGNLTVQFKQNEKPITVQSIPKPGEVWIAPRLSNLLSVGVGDWVELGAVQLRVAGILVREPSRGGDMFSFAPRIMINGADLKKTQLIQYGSRIKYQLLVAGQAKEVSAFGAEITQKLARGERIQDLTSARPEIKSALEKAETFLGLAAMVSILLSIAAMLLASRPYILRNVETAGLLRCFGASRTQIKQILLWQSLLIAFIGASIGCLFGYLLQSLLANVAGTLFLETLPAPSFKPVLIGYAISFTILLALMLPNIQAIQHHAVVNILRAEVETSIRHAGLRLIPVILVITIMILMLAKSLTLAAVVIIGFITLCLLSTGLAYLFAQLLDRFSQSFHQARYGWFNMVKLGLGNLKRNAMLTIVQVLGFSLGAMVLVLLMIVKNDLLNTWQATLPQDAPNRFMINIQPTQTETLTLFLRQLGVQQPQIFPMIRGRLIEKNGHPITPDLYQNERAKRLVSREFNLSMAANMQTDNRLLAGVWWRQQEANKPMVSIEKDIAEALDIKLGDQLTYDIAGQTIRLNVTSIRKVDWDSMRANFFAITPPETLANFPKSYMTAFYLQPQQSKQLDGLLKQLPNITMIDVASLMDQVRGIMHKMHLAVAYVFMLCLVAGLVVLYAALVATKDARAKEAALLRVFGASKNQVGIAVIVEYLGIALIAVTIALFIANVIAYYLSSQVFEIAFSINMTVNLIAYTFALLLIPFSAWLVIRPALHQPPKTVLNSI